MTDFLVKHLVQHSEEVHDPQVREKYGILSGVVGIVLNLLLSASKFFAGLITGSIAIMADAFNNLSDAGASVVTLVGFRLAGQRADDNHPFGHGRIEYLAGLLVALAILVVGLELGKTSIEKIIKPEAVTFSAVSLVILGVSILVKLWMSLFNRNLSRRIESAAMAATATDSLSDVVATSAVLLGTLIGKFVGHSIDGWVGVLVALFVLRAGWGAAKDTLNPLLGQSPDPALVAGLQQTVLAHPQVVGMHDLIVHDYGPGRRMCSLHAEVPMDADIMEVHDVIDGIERELKKKFRLETSIHMDPIATHDAQINHMRGQVAQLVQEVYPGMSIHDFRMTAGPHHTNLIFDVVAPHKCTVGDDEICAAIRQVVREKLGENYFTVIEVDRAYAEQP